MVTVRPHNHLATHPEVSDGRRTTLLLRFSNNRYVVLMNSNQAKRLLGRKGCIFESGKGGHLLVRRGDKASVLPMHGGSKELGKGLWKKILKDLGIEED